MLKSTIVSAVIAGLISAAGAIWLEWSLLVTWAVAIGGTLFGPVIIALGAVAILGFGVIMGKYHERRRRVR